MITYVIALLLKKSSEKKEKLFFSQELLPTMIKWQGEQNKILAKKSLQRKGLG